MKIVIPMAGRGSRFQAEAQKNPEYAKPKPLISVRGEPMILWALRSLPFVDLPQRPARTSFKTDPKDLFFISLEEQQEKYGIIDIFKNLFGQEIKVLIIPKITRGAAETALQAKEFINSDEDIIISDSDHYFDGSFLYEKILHKNKDTAGIIPVFRPPDNSPKWSFSLVEEGDQITAVGEKDKTLVEKGAYANIGGYYFSSGKMFVDEVEQMITENDFSGDEGKKEFYVAPVYQRLIQKGEKIIAALTPQVWGLGTPKDLEYFEKNFRN